MPDSVVIIAGGNDLDGGKTTPSEIANLVIEAGIVAKLKGASKVFISSVLPRSSFWFQVGRHELNHLLKCQCAANNFIFIDHPNINLREHLNEYDGVHLNKEGSNLLQSNLLDFLNAVDD